MNSTSLSRSLRTHPLWDFALALYATDDIEPCCLTLQDAAGADVCELLWLCWLDRHGATVTDDVDAILETVRQWQTDMTRPLRYRRRTLKAAVPSSPSLDSLRQALKHAERLAEQEALSRLQTLAENGCGIRPLHHRDLPLSARLQCLLPNVESPLSEPFMNALTTLAAASTALTLPPSRASLS
ncbi:TIGR02444 family protein [Aidingimonas lacisalsi]|uniref:TIGR02444 family protein n=1 Tax=Aidingimonas lacisalsi TaxID=2604086 RepID=UPI0013761301|nr:TIGR02444 family protein [Aidingimonas lacisalsi]